MLHVYQPHRSLPLSLNIFISLCFSLHLRVELLFLVSCSTLISTMVGFREVRQLQYFFQILLRSVRKEARDPFAQNTKLSSVFSGPAPQPPFQPPAENFIKLIIFEGMKIPRNFGGGEAPYFKTKMLKKTHRYSLMEQKINVACT